MDYIKVKLRFSSSLAVSIVLFTAFINHLLTFLAYDWYSGVDSYSDDICGLQLVSGQFFDIFPILYRSPLIPMVKNFLYLIFEGHPYGLSILIHSLGIVTALLAYRLGSRFHKTVGFAMGMLMALNLPTSVYFHHISVPTFFLPLLLLAADRFVVWVKEPNAQSLTLLVIITFLCVLARTEAIILIPIFWICGWLGHRHWKQAAVFLITCIILYNLVCLFYYTHFGYWGITYKTGLALFTRIMSSAQDSQFSVHNGPASQKIGEYMSREWPSRVKDLHLFWFRMYTFNLAQQELGFIEADRLFKQASIETIHSGPWKFAKFTFLRVLGQLDLYYTPGLNFSEFPSETESGHMWGFREERMQDKREYYKSWLPAISTLGSPLQWEKRVLKDRLYRMLGLKSETPPLPKSFRLSLNVVLNESGEVVFSNCGDGIMEERLWSCRDLDVYFFLAYWGQRGWSKRAVRTLEYWDILMPKPKMRINLHRIMWVLWIIGILFNRERWRSMSLSAILLFSVFYGICLCIFSDNFGGRLALYSRAYLWFGALCGIQTLLERTHIIKLSSNR